MIVTALNASMKMMILMGREKCQQMISPLSSAHPIEKYNVLTPDMALVAAKERVAL